MLLIREGTAPPHRVMWTCGRRLPSSREDTMAVKSNGSRIWRRPLVADEALSVNTASSARRQHRLRCRAQSTKQIHRQGKSTPSRHSQCIDPASVVPESFLRRHQLGHRVIRVMDLRQNKTGKRRHDLTTNGEQAFFKRPSYGVGRRRQQFVASMSYASCMKLAGW